MPLLTKDDRNVLFVHVPKTGGSSIERLFQAAGWTMTYHDHRVEPGSMNRLRRCTPQHMHASMLQELFRLERMDAVFMVVRDPIARFRSEYVWRQGTDVDPSAAAIDRWATKVFERQRSNPFVMGNHIRPQVEFLVDDARVFRLEDGLDDAVAELNREFDLGLPAELPRAQTSEAMSGIRSSEVEIDRPLMRRLEKFYRQDFRRFGY